MPQEWKGLIIVPVYKKGNKRECSNYSDILLVSTMYKILFNILLSRLTPYPEEINGIIKVDFDTTGQLLIIYFAFVKYLRKKWQYNEAVHQLFVDFKKAYDLARREILYNIFIEFGIPMKLVRIIKMCLKHVAESR